eukprot:189229_1
MAYDGGMWWNFNCFSFFTNGQKVSVPSPYTRECDFDPIFTTTPPQTTATPSEFESNCTAKVCAHGDNQIQLDVSYDGGMNWDYAVASESNWQDTMTAVINPIDADTVLRFTVTDEGWVGGFLATVQLCGDNGYVFGFYTDQINTFFDVISDSEGDVLIDQFDAFGTGPWANDVDEDTVSCMNTEADWIWNDKTGNTMVFELYFGHHIDILQRLECIPHETPAPTTDCCTMSLDDYLDTCYCSDETEPPTLPPIQIATLVGVPVEYTNRAAQFGAGSVGVHEMNGEVDEVVYRQTMESMKQIKHMLYGTWVIILSCLVINIGYSKGVSHCNKNKTKLVYKSDEEDV